MNKPKPILQTEKEEVEYNKLRNEFANTALNTMSKYITSYGGATVDIPDGAIEAMAKNAYKIADAMLVASGQFKFE